MPFGGAGNCTIRIRKSGSRLINLHWGIFTTDYPFQGDVNFRRIPKYMQVSCIYVTDIFICEIFFSYLGGIKVDKFIYDPQRRIYVAARRINREADGRSYSVDGHAVNSLVKGALGAKSDPVDTSSTPIGQLNRVVNYHIKNIQGRDDFKGDLTKVDFSDLAKLDNYVYQGKFLQIIKTPDGANGSEVFSEDNTVIWLGQYKDGDNYVWIVMSGTPNGQLRDFDELTYKGRSGSGLTGVYTALKSLSDGELSLMVNEGILSSSFVENIALMVSDEMLVDKKSRALPIIRERIDQERPIYGIHAAELIYATAIFTIEEYGPIKMDLSDSESPIKTKESLLNDGESGGNVDRIIYARPYVIQSASTNKETEDGILKKLKRKAIVSDWFLPISSAVCTIVGFIIGKIF